MGDAAKGPCKFAIGYRIWRREIIRTGGFGIIDQKTNRGNVVLEMNPGIELLSAAKCVANE